MISQVAGTGERTGWERSTPRPFFAYPSGMNEHPRFLDDVAEADDVGEAASDEAESDREPAPPIESRFLYVDVAAQRAKQLRRGALPKLDELTGDAGADGPGTARRKLERIAMREVDRGKIRYDVPAPARRE